MGDMTIFSEFRELVQSTERLLLENIPLKKWDKPSSLPSLIKKIIPHPPALPATPAKEADPQRPLLPPIQSPKAVELEKAGFQWIKELCPFLQLHDSPLLNQLVILKSGNETKEEEALLQRLQKKLSSAGLPTQMQKASADFSQDHRAILASKAALLSHPPLLEKAKRNSEGKPYIGSIPLFMIPPSDTLLKDPQARQKFWNALMQEV
jgi:hypothetical protein